MNVQRTQGYAQGFGMTPTEVLVKNNISVSRQSGRALIYGACNDKGKGMGALTLFGKDLSDTAVYRFLVKQRAKLVKSS